MNQDDNDAALAHQQEQEQQQWIIDLYTPISVMIALFFN